MNIMNVLTVRHMKLNKRRTFVTIIGVALSVCMITAVATFTSSFLNLLQRITIEETGNWHILYNSLTEEQIVQIEEVMGKRKSLTVSKGTDIGYALFPESKNESKPYWFVRGFDENGFQIFNYKLLEGRYPENSYEIVISVPEDDDIPYKIGDIVTLEIGDRFHPDIDSYMGQSWSYVPPTEEREGESIKVRITREFTVTGIMERPSTEYLWSPGYTALTLLDDEIPVDKSKITVYGTFKKVPRNLFRLGERMAKEAGMDPLKAGYNISLLRYHMLVTDERLLSTFYILASFVILLIMIGSVSLIYNAFAISISERSKHLGMLASVGATKKQKRNSVYFEGFATGLIAVPIGLFFGTLGIGVTLQLLHPLISGMVGDTQKFTLVVSFPAIVASVLLSAVTVFISVWVPAKRASKISPIDAIRQTKDIKLTPKAVKTTGISKALFGFEAELALKNLKRNNKRYKATILSLVLSIVLFLSVASLSSMTNRSAALAVNNMPYDLSVHVTSQETEEDILAFYKGIQDMKEVEKSAVQKTLYWSLETKGEILAPKVKEMYDAGYYQMSSTFTNEDGEKVLKTYFGVELIALDEEAFEQYARLVGADMASLKDGNNPKGILLNVTNIKAKEQYIRSEYLNVKKGDSLNLVFLPDQSVLTMEIEIAAMAEQAPLGTEIPRYPYNIQIFISQETFDAIYSGYPQKYRNIQPELYIRTSDSEELSDQIFLYKDRTSIDEIFVIDYNADHREQRRFLTFVYVFFYGFVALITAICIANIFNTVSTGIQLRKREFGMMLSVGMTPKGFYKMLYYESLFYGVKALLFGLPVSYIIMRLLHRILGRSFEISFSIPWKSVIGAVIVVFAIVGVTMFYSGSKVKDENIMDMLRAENL